MACACGDRLRTSLDLISKEGRGVILYLRPPRDIDTLLGGHDPKAGGVDPLQYGLGSQILADLGVRSMHLLAGNPDRRYSLDGFGLQISEVIPLT